MLVLALAAAGCHRPAADVPGARVDVQVEPQPSRVGPAAVTVALGGPGGAPLTGASVRLEGNMSHAGMVPVFADATEVAPGRYRGPFEFTMSGDWLITVAARLPDGRTLERHVAVLGVRPR